MMVYAPQTAFVTVDNLKVLPLLSSVILNAAATCSTCGLCHHEELMQSFEASEIHVTTAESPSGYWQLWIWIWIWYVS